MAVQDEYRKHAQRCRLVAEKSHNSADRAFWLLLVQNWQTLAQEQELEPFMERQPKEEEQV